MISLRPYILSLFLTASFPFVAVADDAVIEENYQIIRETDDEEEFYRAAQQIVELGTVVIPNLTNRLVETEDDVERVDLTFLLAAVLGQSRVTGQSPEVPPELLREVAALMSEPGELALEGNLANLAGSFDPQPTEITVGLLSILSRAEHEGLRATTSAVIAMNAGDNALPLIHDALRESDNDRFSGDLAAILRGTQPPDDIVAILQALLESDDGEARQAAARTLDAAGIGGPGQLDAALRNLEEARTEVQLSLAASAVYNHTDGSQRVADALVSSLDRAHRGEERREIFRALAASGDAGVIAIHDVVRSTEDVDVLEQYILAMNSSPQSREDPRTLALLIEMATDDSNPPAADAAAFGLNLHRQAAVDAIDEVIAEGNASDAVRERLMPVRDRLAR